MAWRPSSPTHICGTWGNELLTWWKNVTKIVHVHLVGRVVKRMSPHNADITCVNYSWCDQACRGWLNTVGLYSSSHQTHTPRSREVSKQPGCVLKFLIALKVNRRQCSSLPRRKSNHKAVVQLKTHIWLAWDFMNSHDKASYRLVNGVSGLKSYNTHIHTTHTKKKQKYKM